MPCLRCLMAERAHLGPSSACLACSPFPRPVPRSPRVHVLIAPWETLNDMNCPRFRGQIAFLGCQTRWLFFEQLSRRGGDWGDVFLTILMETNPIFTRSFVFGTLPFHGRHESDRAEWLKTCGMMSLTCDKSRFMRARLGGVGILL